MLGTRLREFFSQLNFLLMATNVPGATIMKNENDGETLYVVLLDNDNRQIWNSGTISAINYQLSSRHVYPNPEAHILFIVVTNDSERDRYLASDPSVQVWLADCEKEELIVAEGQDDDFFGLRYGLEKTIGKHETTENFWDIKERLKDKKRLPYVTITLIVINVIWFIVLSFMGDTTDAGFMREMGADFGPSVFVDFQFYRLILSMFMHFGFPHLAGNMVYLAIAGSMAEKNIGHLRFFLIYMLSGIASSLFSTAYYYLTEQYTVSAGASGAIYGIIGIIIYMIGKNRGRMGTVQTARRIIIMLIFLFYSNFVVTGVDVVAHLFGLIFGIILSFAFLHTSKPRGSNRASM